MTRVKYKHSKKIKSEIRCPLCFEIHNLFIAKNGVFFVYCFNWRICVYFNRHTIGARYLNLLRNVRDRAQMNERLNQWYKENNAYNYE